MEVFVVLLKLLMALIAIGIGIGLYIIFQMSRIRWVVDNLKNLKMVTVFDRWRDPIAIQFYFGRWKVFEVSLSEEKLVERGSLLNRIYTYWREGHSS